jgi:hypothetical protein
VTEWTPGFAGTLEKFYYVTNVPASTPDKLSTLNLEIGTVDVTGGLLELTTAKIDTLGKVVAASDITALNTFGATSTISVEAATTTEFIEGSGSLIITYSRKIIA